MANDRIKEYLQMPQEQLETCGYPGKAHNLATPKNRHYLNFFSLGLRCRNSEGACPNSLQFVEFFFACGNLFTSNVVVVVVVVVIVVVIVIVIIILLLLFYNVLLYCEGGDLEPITVLSEKV